MVSGRSDPRDMTREALERLLALLDPEPANAARRYQQLRRRLTRLFEWRAARFPEDLTDETISRVARKIDEGVKIRAEDPFRYCCGVAHLVFKEVLRERRRERQLQDPGSRAPFQPPEEEPDDDDERMAIFQECLDRLPEEDHRDLILEYHEGERRERIEHRRALADGLDIPLNALRIRVHRIRAKLEKCVKKRLPAA